MSLKKCCAFLITFLFLIGPVSVYAGGDIEPVRLDPWDDVHKTITYDPHRPGGTGQVMPPANGLKVVSFSLGWLNITWVNPVNQKATKTASVVEKSSLYKNSLSAPANTKK
jgi:hypothetical protein